MRPRSRLGGCLPALACAAVIIAGCGSPTGGVSGRPAGGVSGRPTGGVSGTPAPSRAGCSVTVPGFSCVMQQRIRSARRYLRTAPGRIGLVLHDRATGATWRSAHAAEAFPAASTVKLAIVTDLLERAAAGTITLSATDRTLMDAALHSSSDTAADQLWAAYEDGSFGSRIRRYGMTTASFTTGPYWGFMSCSPEDLSHLMGYVLNRLPAADRDYLVSQLRNVAPNQQWGVWGAGPRNRPGNKNGWVDIGGVWTLNTVGFAGPGERYTLAIMDELGGEGGFTEGANALTQLAAILFQGHQIPAPRVSATP